MAAPTLRAAAALILAGGRSTRFGADKALARFHGTPLFAHSLQQARAQFTQVALVAKDVRPYAALAPAGVALVQDGTPIETPLAGLVAGIEWNPLDVSYAFAVDMPFAVHAQLLDALFAALPGHDVALPVLRGEMQPLCGLWRKEPTLREARDALSKGQGPRALLARLRAALVPFDDERPFLDADTKEELARLETL
jgi:molybdopterin-guanine dinucleotide biosynthesis protein A